MNLERRSLSRLAVPLKALADRFAFGALLLISVALLIIGKAEVRLLDAVNTAISDTLMPVLATIAQPIDASQRFADNVGELFALREQNLHLREQNRRLLEWRGLARQLALENAALRQAMNMEGAPEPPTVVAARVVADTGGPFVQTVLVNAGAAHGVAKGMAAVNERGLVGRVIEVGQRSARVLLLTDFNSRVPVMVEPSRDQGILTGDNSPEPRLEFLPLNPRLSVGDRVVTSGRGGVLAPGLAVGIVTRIADQTVTVAPLVDWSRLEHVRLLQFAPVVPPEDLEALQKEIYGPPPPPDLSLRDTPTAALPPEQGRSPGIPGVGASTDQPMAPVPMAPDAAAPPAILVEPVPGPPE